MDKMFHVMTYADSVTQQKGTIPIQEGKHVLINCTYDYSGSTPMLFWYEQYPHEAPRLLLTMTQYEASDEEKRRRRGFSAKIEKNSKSFHLEKNSSEVSDSESAVYYCALRPTVRENCISTRTKTRETSSPAPCDEAGPNVLGSSWAGVCLICSLK
uniref:Ig-like domain-containing protein n=1 Tax=Chelydra serpentina TaxID=8475 RepID=A0A8C3SFS8_CHESE